MSRSVKVRQVFKLVDHKFIIKVMAHKQKMFVILEKI